ncbi:uncharacterized protein LOC118564524 [Fundulus heteroclitus]|uniref:uncharacterized protein LOC118564524 n=1 Tax=Fundulus heteroclitus TaxID=8078 RepID=UPI00165C67C7|nr:uncharacterized protein LOC118564524 [Fundulus heteroclitus]XP_035998781.1 uncharacterized protein LOC118564524 [Fundulus heteroclitus]
MGKCKFQQKWLEDAEFGAWLKPVDGNDNEGFYRVCKKKIRLCTMGVNALRSHMKWESHRSATRCRQQLTMSSYFSVTDTVTSAVATGTSTAAAGASSTAGKSDVLRTFGSNATLNAEVLWCLNTAMQHHSYASNEGVSELFQAMFPDSEIAKSFACGKDKTGYILKFGLAPHFKNELISAVNNAGPFVLMFDESFNQSTKNKQLDVHVRFWEAGFVQSRFFGSQFMGHSKAQDLLHHFKNCVRQLDMKNLLSIGMDGPNVNLKFLNDFQQEHAEVHGGRQLINVGSCGLHTLHNSLKTGFSIWNIEKLLRAMHFVFHNVPARREDYTKHTGSSIFPLPFCGHRWVENLPVAERAIEVWPKLKEYVKAVHKKRATKPWNFLF